MPPVVEPSVGISCFDVDASLVDVDGVQAMVLSVAGMPALLLFEQPTMNKARNVIQSLVQKDLCLLITATV